MPSDRSRSRSVGMTMDSRLLEKILAAFQKVGLEVVLVGNAAAAVHGAPVTTQDADCIVRDTELNMRKARAAAQELGASISQPFLPASDVVRLLGNGIQVDLMFSMSRRTFNHIRSRAVQMSVGSARAWVASLEDIIESKRKANRPKDRAALPILEETLRVKKALADMGVDTAGMPKETKRRKKKTAATRAAKR